MYGQPPYVPPNYSMGATPQMQQRLSYLSQQQFPQQNMGMNPSMQSQMPMNIGNSYAMGLKGRLVTNVEEAKAAQIDLDGSSTFFPCVAEKKIYEKAIDLNGLPVFRVYTLQEDAKGIPTYASNEVVTSLQQRVEQLEQTLQNVLSNKGVVINESVSANANDAVNKQPNGYVSTANGQQPYNATSYANGAGKKP